MNKKRKTHDIQAALLHSHRHVFFGWKREKKRRQIRRFHWGMENGGDFPVILSFDCVKNYSIGYPRRKEAKFMNYRQENTDKIV